MKFVPSSKNKIIIFEKILNFYKYIKYAFPISIVIHELSLSDIC